MPKGAFDAEYLRSILKYDPDTGAWTWLIHKWKNRIGSIAGSIYAGGYRVIVINRKHYTSAELAWLYMTGTWSNDTVDHKNRNKLDDRWDNFREATHSQQGHNVDLSPRNTSGVTGVRWSEPNKKWIVTVHQNTIVGYFATKEEAIKARQKAEEEIWAGVPVTLHRRVKKTPEEAKKAQLAGISAWKKRNPAKVAEYNRRYQAGKAKKPTEK